MAAKTAQALAPFPDAGGKGCTRTTERGHNPRAARKVAGGFARSSQGKGVEFMKRLLCWQSGDEGSELRSINITVDSLIAKRKRLRADLMAPIDKRLNLRPRICRVILAINKTICFLLLSTGLSFLVYYAFDAWPFFRKFRPTLTHFGLLACFVGIEVSGITLCFLVYYFLVGLVGSLDEVIERHVVRRWGFTYPVIEQTGLEDTPFVEDREELISDLDQSKRARRALVRVGKYHV